MALIACTHDHCSTRCEPDMMQSHAISVEDIISLLTAAQSMAEDAGHFDLAGQIALAIAEALQIAVTLSQWHMQ